jgi:NAD(P)H-flavin reductase
MRPCWAEILEITPEVPGISTYWLRFLDAKLRKEYRFRPGQFNMLYLPGLGEAAISISSNSEEHERIGHTVRHIGNVTYTLGRMKPGERIGLRGPFGSAWPIETCLGQDIYIVAGGIGMPPLRSLLYYIINHRADFGKVTVLYGARTPADLQFASEYKAWQAAGVDMLVTVDRADETWNGPVGVVPMMFYRTRLDPKKSVILSCGPEIMMRFVVFEAMARRIPAERIYISMERNMKCGIGSCGHCQVGPFFVCKDGPVFSYAQLEPYYNVEEL